MTSADESQTVCRWAPSFKKGPTRSARASSSAARSDARVPRPGRPQGSRASSRTWVQIRPSLKMKMQNTSKTPEYQNASKIPTYIKSLRNFQIFDVPVNDSDIFWYSKRFPRIFSDGAWRMLKKSTVVFKVGVDAADILTFWALCAFSCFD